MPNNKLLSPFLFLILLLLIACQPDKTTIQTEAGQVEISTEELLSIIGEVYVYGYPMVLMDLTKRKSTNIEQPHSVTAAAPINQLGHFRLFPDHTFTSVVKRNVDIY